MMDDNEFKNKVDQDIKQVKNDITTLGDDGETGLTRKFEQLTDETKKTVDVAVKNVNKAVGHGLSEYNAKVQDVVNRVPGDFAKKVAGYPWVSITVSLVVGLLLGVILKPGRQPLR